MNARKTLHWAGAMALAFSTQLLAGGLPSAGAQPARPAAKSAGGLTNLSAAKCSGAQCTIAVAAPDCAIAATPEYLIVTSKNAKLRWVIQTKGYTFPEKDGIFFKKEYNAKYSSEFDNCGRVNDTTWECRDKNVNPPMVFKYGINVLKPDKSACRTLDPTIINDMEETTP